MGAAESFRDVRGRVGRALSVRHEDAGPTGRRGREEPGRRHGRERVEARRVARDRLGWRRLDRDGPPQHAFERRLVGGREDVRQNTVGETRDARRHVGHGTTEPERHVLRALETRWSVGPFRCEHGT